MAHTQSSNPRQEVPPPSAVLALSAAMLFAQRELPAIEYAHAVVAALQAAGYAIVPIEGGLR